MSKNMLIEIFELEWGRPTVSAVALT